MITRVKQIIDYYGYTTRAFEQKISVSDGTIRKFLGGKISLKVDTILKITANFPQISLDWLILAKGEMLRKNEKNEDKIPNNSQNIGQNFGNATYLSEATPKYKASPNSTIEALYRAIRAQQDTIDAQQKLIGSLERHIESLERKLSE